MNDICNKNMYNPKEYDYSFSIYTSWKGATTITFFAKPLKYQNLLLLVMKDYFKQNEYPNDIIIHIILLYNIV